MKSSYQKYIIVGIFLIFVGAGVFPNISGHIQKMSKQSQEKMTTNFISNNNYLNAYWEFDECSGSILEDSSLHDYDGTISGATWTSGHSGCALDFDGIDDYVSLDSHSEDLGFNKTDDLIYSFWINSSNEGLIYSATAPWGINPELRIELLSNGSLLFKAYTSYCGIILISPNSYNDGNLHFINFTYNGLSSNPTVTLYVDNNFEISVTHWLCPIESDEFAKTKIGKQAHNSTSVYDGLIDDFKIIKYPGGNKQESPIIDGPTYGDPGEEYDFTFTIYDPEGDDI